MSAKLGEITPEMIEAGSLALSEYDPRFESDEDAVVRIYNAMLIAAKNHSRMMGPEAASDEELLIEAQEDAAEHLKSHREEIERLRAPLERHIALLRAKAVEARELAAKLTEGSGYVATLAYAIGLENAAEYLASCRELPARPPR